MMSMIRKTHMRRNQLQRIFFGQLLGIVSFPAGDITRHRRPFFIIGIEFGQALRNKLDLAAVGSQLMRLVRPLIEDSWDLEYRRDDLHRTSDWIQ